MSHRAHNLFWLSSAVQVFESRSFNGAWLLSETHSVLKKQLKAEKKELTLVAGAMAGFASALSLCKVSELYNMLMQTYGA